MDASGQLPGTVVLVFQPAEEGLGGAKCIVEAPGGLRGAQAMFGMHVWPSRPAGTWGGLAVGSPWVG